MVTSAVPLRWCPNNPVTENIRIILHFIGDRSDILPRRRDFALVASDVRKLHPYPSHMCMSLMKSNLCLLNKI